MEKLLFSRRSAQVVPPVEYDDGKRHPQLGSSSADPSTHGLYEPAVSWNVAPSGEPTLRSGLGCVGLQGPKDDEHGEDELAGLVVCTRYTSYNTHTRPIALESSAARAVAHTCMHTPAQWILPKHYGEISPVYTYP